jgi:hypothetical protein
MGVCVCTQRNLVSFFERYMSIVVVTKESADSSGVGVWHSLPGIVGSNPAGGLDICLL